MRLSLYSASQVDIGQCNCILPTSKFPMWIFCISDMNKWVMIPVEYKLCSSQVNMPVSDSNEECISFLAVSRPSLLDLLSVVDMYATGWRVPSLCSCERTPPMATSLVSTLTTNVSPQCGNARVASEHNCSLSMERAASHASFHSNRVFSLVSLLRV